MSLVGRKLIIGFLTRFDTNQHARPQKLAHTVYPVTPNAGMFYQRGYKHLRRGNTQGKKTCNSRISIVPISNITFKTSCKRAFLRNNGASKQ